MNTQGTVSPLFFHCLWRLILIKYPSHADLKAQSSVFLFCFVLFCFVFFLSVFSSDLLWAKKRTFSIALRLEGISETKQKNNLFLRGQWTLLVTSRLWELFCLFLIPPPPLALSGIVSSLIRIFNVLCKKEREDVIGGCFRRPSMVWWHDRYCITPNWKFFSLLILLYVCHKCDTALICFLCNFFTKMCTFVRFW